MPLPKQEYSACLRYGRVHAGSHRWRRLAQHQAAVEQPILQRFIQPILRLQHLGPAAHAGVHAVFHRPSASLLISTSSAMLIGSSAKICSQSACWRGCEPDSARVCSSACVRPAHAARSSTARAACVCTASSAASGQHQDMPPRGNLRAFGMVRIAAAIGTLMVLQHGFFCTRTEYTWAERSTSMAVMECTATAR